MDKKEISSLVDVARMYGTRSSGDTENCGPSPDCALIIASWTGMYTDPTAWPLHENTMLEGAKADTTGVALPLNPVGGSRIERLSCAERPTLLGYCLDRSKAVFILTR